MGLGTGVEAHCRPARQAGARTDSGAGSQAPALLRAPAVTGAGRIGQPLAADPGAWSGAPAPRLALQWQRAGWDIAGACGASFVPGAAEAAAPLRLRVTATNAAGAAQAVSNEIFVHAASADPGDQPDPPIDPPGVPDLSTSPDFTGPDFTGPDFTGPDLTGRILRFSIAGSGLSFDQATGTVGLALDRLQEGLELTVAAAGPDGDTGRFRITIEAAPQAPRLLAAPALAGSGVIGTVVSVDPGRWDGAATVAVQWCRDGVAIAAATGASYTPVAADDGGALTCRVTATNATGSTPAETAALPVRHAAPAVAAVLEDLELLLDSGIASVAAATAFTGDALSYAVTGAEAVIDAATGAVSLPTAALVASATVTVTASNSGGSASVSFRLSVVAVAPAVVAAPTLAGSGKVGAAVGVEAGRWSGQPAPTTALQWCRDGVAIAGATGASYVPVAADDRTELTCRVTASNVAGSAVATTAALAVTRVAPVASGTLPDVALTQGAAAGSVAAAAAFTGDGLSYAVTGAGVIDAATGVVSLPTAALVASATVTVTASNSGGSASVSFRLSVVAAVVPPAAVGSIADVVLRLDDATTVSTQANFSGTDLVYSLLAAPAGVTIMAGSGLVSIAATTALAAARVTVQARNSAGTATQSFALTVRALASVFDVAARLADVAFVYENSAPSWTLKSGLARLVPGTTGRLHGDWSLAGGDGLYRCQVRWNATDTNRNGASPFLFGARIARSGSNFTGLYVEASRISNTERQLRLLDYTGAGTATTLRGTVASAWVWYTWYWFEMEVVGASVRARLYADDATEAPAWQLQATTTTAGAGAFGPGAFPLGTPAVDIKRLEFAPVATTAAIPPAALDGDWDLIQSTEQK